MKENKGTFLTVGLVIALVIAAFAIGSLWTQVQDKNGGNGGNNGGSANAPTPGEPAAVADIPEVTDADRIIGDLATAKFALVEYSDFSCPFCKTFHATAKQAIADNSDLVWVFRHFPLASIHPNAVKEAQASECAAKLGGNDAFWAMADAIYENQPGLVPSRLPELAGELGLDVDAFTSCLDSNETNEFVQNQYQAGYDAGVRGTPGNFIVNLETGEITQLRGAEPLANVQAAIDAFK